jgi:hypothetical protein
MTDITARRTTGNSNHYARTMPEARPERPRIFAYACARSPFGTARQHSKHTCHGKKEKTKDKAARVSALSVPVENGSFRLRGDGTGQVHPGQQALFDEMTTFPLGEHDDLVDAAAFGTAYLLGRPEPRVWLPDGSI